MPPTRAFKSGDSQAVRVPAELAYENTNIELSIERYGDIIVISPFRQNLKAMVEASRAMPKPSRIKPYEPIEALERGF